MPQQTDHIKTSPGLTKQNLIIPAPKNDKSQQRPAPKREICPLCSLDLPLALRRAIFDWAYAAASL